MTRRTKKKNVRHASGMDITPLVQTSRQINIQTYANTDDTAVTKNTPISLIFFTYPDGTETIETAEITIRLNAAEPTIVDGPSSPGVDPKFVSVSITESRISGADDPRAMRVRFAMVGFHTDTSTVLSSPSESVYLIDLV